MQPWFTGRFFFQNLSPDPTKSRPGLFGFLLDYHERERERERESEREREREREGREGGREREREKEKEIRDQASCLDTWAHTMRVVAHRDLYELRLRNCKAKLLCSLFLPPFLWKRESIIQFTRTIQHRYGKICYRYVPGSFWPPPPPLSTGDLQVHCLAFEKHMFA